MAFQDLRELKVDVAYPFLLEVLEEVPRVEVGPGHAVAVGKADEPVHREVPDVRDEAVLQLSNVLL